ncbi:hypothetical protein BW12_07035 [Bifidobacterium sp. UTCIF-3]|uniref:DUF2513 domain-containing protein n=1 Tax=unclassified Bifidobacterium TaxID=2608897 RepID=UPI00112D886B|nr:MULTISPECIES: DUF2513 domain-containing protein [unclassified Bifidobacterium]TPF78359.1 hypothetical protein BW09_04710 [Bifidobacterium sp. UTCIF-1]TPF81220.1 hypothetical protein BW08_00870 [Bifidobacterium sp. UTCIF-24]TPF82001.1 hypothetical protein BW12_07035 [Bifidobacterium sp. UTCIF-3]TPF85151.1 hypothetical protein BW07_00315 [Bifidobacterium sp. UTCIF-36]
MRRDLDLVRSILKTCADASGPVDAHAFTDDAHPFELVAYHVRIMQEAGLVEASLLREAGGSVVHATVGPLTWAGNDFLDAVRSESIWSKTKKTIMTTIGSASFEIVKAVAIKAASDALGL